MSLRAFHFIFIVAATLMAFLYGVWGVHYSAHHEGAFYFASAILSFLCGLVLIGYGFWFLRKIRKGDLK